MLELCGRQVATSVLPNFSIIWVLLLPKVPWFDLDIYVHCFLPVGRFAGNGYVSADIVHIFCLFLSVGVSLILSFSAVCCCLFLKVLPLVFCVVAVFLLEGSSQTSLVCGSLFCKRVFSMPVSIDALVSDVSMGGSELSAVKLSALDRVWALTDEGWAGTSSSSDRWSLRQLFRHCKVAIVCLVGNVPDMSWTCPDMSICPCFWLKLLFLKDTE